MLSTEVRKTEARTGRWETRLGSSSGYVESEMLSSGHPNLEFSGELRTGGKNFGVNRHKRWYLKPWN